ncbi:His-Xaa-Ser system radical SAM maturase HxsC [Shewanella sp. SM72]|uniref:His-Xaa-Ser system radical SAM maturase HxsC n=1 Tax=unclassified Shewanella TaxID=196818 RepID=UPI0021DAE7FE|nr:MULTISPECIES: His-Xaa-Ser system radical SAM maturase HxsC [unclassified Shewanella]MCU8018627.1 His-Xaa-Ser system radical SAM maturase HxsC [Shewanella sp. SM72]MCU8058493.1 His-Xaa-Ser system radical SAM maturase HxsC [Shewanella sp. SM35]MCU8067445.1 His-Xaa-Ser system radical SAM maturase HxsC [Shewanella sp. SM34]
MAKMIRLTDNNVKVISHNTLTETKFFVVTENIQSPNAIREKNALLVRNVTDESPPDGFGAYLYIEGCNLPTVYHQNSYLISGEFEYLSNGDVIRITNKPNLKVVFRVNISTNYLTVTEQCNSFCIMCSQPPKKEDDSHLIREYIRSIPLFSASAKEIGISGGEPTLLGDDFVELLSYLNSYLPRTSIHVLTNGKAFDNRVFVEKISQTKHFDLMFGIPLYSSVPYIHDFIVQDKGAFNRTISGILNLKQYGHKIELRFVIQQSNYEDIELFSEFVSRNLQFIDQVAFMGLEATGFAKSNFDSLWIEPEFYMDKLCNAVHQLSRSKVKVKIFNHQLCMLPKSLWPFSVKSISDWKNCYIDTCELCVEKSACGGFFSTSDGKIPKGIKPFTKI